MLIVRPIIYLFCLVILLSCSKKDDSQSQDQESIDAINQHLRAMVNAFNDGDLDAWMREIADDAVWMVPDQTPLIGKEAVRTFYESLFIQGGKMKGRLSPDNQELIVKGDWAVFRAVLEGTVTPEDGGESFQFSNKFVNLLRKGPDGSWKHVWDIYNPMPLGPQ